MTRPINQESIDLSKYSKHIAPDINSVKKDGKLTAGQVVSNITMKLQAKFLRVLSRIQTGEWMDNGKIEGMAKKQLTKLKSLKEHSIDNDISKVGGHQKIIGRLKDRVESLINAIKPMENTELAKSTLKDLESFKKELVQAGKDLFATDELFGVFTEAEVEPRIELSDQQKEEKKSAALLKAKSLKNSHKFNTDFPKEGVSQIRKDFTTKPVSRLLDPEKTADNKGVAKEAYQRELNSARENMFKAMDHLIAKSKEFGLTESLGQWRGENSAENKELANLLNKIKSSDKHSEIIDMAKELIEIVDRGLIQNNTMVENGQILDVDLRDSYTKFFTEIGNLEKVVEKD